MNQDVETIRQWTLVALTIAAFPVSAFPLLYLVLSPWYKSQLGRAVMLQSLSIACAIDFSVVYRHWAFTSNIQLLLTIWLFMIIFIGAAATYLTVVLVVLNFIKHEKASTKNVEQRSDPGQASLPD